MFELIYHDMYYSCFLLSQQSSEQFLLLLPPNENCGNSKSLSPKCKISKLDYV